MKTLKELLIFIAGVFLLVACTIIEEKVGNRAAGPVSINVLRIDLTDPAYAALNEVGGSLVFVDEGIIVAKTFFDNTVQTFIAADYKCSCCGMQIGFNSDIATCDGWVCNCCQVKFDSYGSVICGVSNKPLETHSVSQSGNILTIPF
jgi:hypothetical protein